ncbi:hypothetical protein FM113_08870 [Leucobacter sp. 7(1)]|nr:hypothetical protein FM113_08870 [Leucobacter sp. 7(1)]
MRPEIRHNLSMSCVWQFFKDGVIQAHGAVACVNRYRFLTSS